MTHIEILLIKHTDTIKKTMPDGKADFGNSIIKNLKNSNKDADKNNFSNYNRITNEILIG